MSDVEGGDKSQGVRPDLHLESSLDTFRSTETTNLLQEKQNGSDDDKQSKSKREEHKVIKELRSSGIQRLSSKQKFINAGNQIRMGVRLKKLMTNKNNKHMPNVVKYLMFQESTVSDVNSLIGEDSEAAPVGLKDFLYHMITKKISILLVFFPLGYLSHAYEWNPLYIFWFNFLAMVPLASMLGDFTEELAMNTNQVIGGLLNATFGNAVEVVVAIEALQQNEIRVVQASMLGSIFSNLLLVLGCCLFFGGYKGSSQKFNSVAVSANMSLLALASLSLVLPTPFAKYYEIEDEHVLNVSRIAALYLMFMYGQLLVFQLKTHANLFADEDDDAASITFWQSFTGLTVVTGIITFSSDWLVASIDGFVEESGLSRTFVGVILIPIVGNAVEHITAVTVAMKNKMDLALAIAIGSCTQIALFVIPLIVLIGWGTNKDMTLNFPHFEIILLIMSIWIVSVCVSDGNSNWLLGSLLVTSYLMVATGFWFESVKNY